MFLVASSKHHGIPNSPIMYSIYRAAVIEIFLPEKKSYQMVALHHIFFHVQLCIPLIYFQGAVPGCSLHCRRDDANSNHHIWKGTKTCQSKTQNMSQQYAQLFVLFWNCILRSKWVIQCICCMSDPLLHSVKAVSHIHGQCKESFSIQT